jgi:hypothetical protein
VLIASPRLASAEPDRRRKYAFSFALRKVNRIVKTGLALGAQRVHTVWCRGDAPQEDETMGKTIWIENQAGGDRAEFAWSGELTDEMIRHADSIDTLGGPRFRDGAAAADAAEQYEQILADRRDYA